MEIKKIDGEFSICKVKDFSLVKWESEYIFIGNTDEENSLVCLTDDVPANTTEREDRWRAFRVHGTLDFSLIGIIAKISTLLADSRIGIFVISTYNTDYILTKQDNYAKALHILELAGYQVL